MHPFYNVCSELIRFADERWSFDPTWLQIYKQRYYTNSTAATKKSLNVGGEQGNQCHYSGQDFKNNWRKPLINLLSVSKPTSKYRATALNSPLSHGNRPFLSEKSQIIC